VACLATATLLQCSCTSCDPTSQVTAGQHSPQVTAAAAHHIEHACAATANSRLRSPAAREAVGEPPLPLAQGTPACTRPQLICMMPATAVYVFLVQALRTAGFGFAKNDMPGTAVWICLPYDLAETAKSAAGAAGFSFYYDANSLSASTQCWRLPALIACQAAFTAMQTSGLAQHKHAVPGRTAENWIDIEDQDGSTVKVFRSHTAVRTFGCRQDSTPAAVLGGCSHSLVPVRATRLRQGRLATLCCRWPRCWSRLLAMRSCTCISSDWGWGVRQPRRAWGGCMRR